MCPSGFFVCLFLVVVVVVFFQKGINELSSQPLFGKSSKIGMKLYIYAFFFLSDISASSSLHY